MKVKIIESCVAEGSVWLPGDEPEMDDATAERLISEDKAEAVQPESED